MAYGTVNADVIGTSVAGSNLGAGNASIMKNRIINGAMVIDQRNAGAVVTTASDFGYSLDRWMDRASVASKYTVQQNSGSVTPPAGFVNYLGVVSTSAYSVGATDFLAIEQRIEGYNFADLNFGGANAKTVTVSFWVRSSLTGTFGGCLRNGVSDYNYPFSYTISSANTWEQKSITIVGAPAGTWSTTNGIGAILSINIGVGSTNTGTANAWTTSSIYNPTGATSVVGTNGATFYITGVQLEVGSSATGFEYVNYQTSLANCQRYYQVAMYAGKQYQSLGVSANQSSTNAETIYQLKTSMRSPPTLSYASGSYYFVYINSVSFAFSSLTQDSNYLNTESTNIFATISGATAGQAGTIRQNNTLGFVAFSAEL